MDPRHRVREDASGSSGGVSALVSEHDELRHDRPPRQWHGGREMVGAKTWEVVPEEGFGDG